MGSAPLPEAEPRSDGDSEEDAAKAAVHQLSVWAHNRCLYPGWIAVPIAETVRLGLTTRRWTPRILEAIESRKPLEQLDAVYEVVWRLEVGLNRLSADLVGTARVVLQRALDWGLASEARTEAAALVALALVTEARFRLHKEDFEEAVASASVFAEHLPDVANRIHHEKCLWFLYDLDFEAIRTELDAWIPTGDPFWGVRKAALMVETGHERDVTPLLRSTIQAIRRRRRSSASIAVRSRESSALYLLNRLQADLGDEADESYHSTMREFRRFNCDPEGDIQRVLRQLQQQPTTADPGPPFGLGERAPTRPTLHFREHYVSGPEALRADAASRAIRFGEAWGLPPSAGHWSITAHLLSAAAEALYADGRIELALRVMLRITTYDGNSLLKKLLSRPKLASLPYELVDALTAMCMRVVDYYIARGIDVPVREGAVHPVDRLRVSMESLSRFALRMPPDRAADLFAKALSYHSDAAIVGHPLIQGAARSLLERTWEALPRKERIRFGFDILNAPVIGVDGFDIEPFRVMDPGALLEQGDSALPERNDRTEEKWRETVRFLLRCLAFDREARSRAMLRLVTVVMADRLAQHEVDWAAQTIWDPERHALHGLPAEDTLRHWVFLCMPQPREGMANDWFREKWISNDTLLATDDASSLDDALFQLGDGQERAYGQDFEIEYTSHDEQRRILELARKWADAPVPRELVLKLPFDAQTRRSLQRAIHGLTTLLLHIEPPRALVDALQVKQRSLHDVGVYAMSLLVPLYKHAADSRDDIQAALKKALASEKEQLVYSAVGAIQCWLHFAKLSVIESPPGDLILEVGFAIATRRRAALDPALWLAKWVFEDGGEREQDALHQLTVEGLDYLLRELDYSQMDFTNDEAVPDMRWKCVGIARAMHELTYDDAIIQRWLELAREDPLPEVRHTVSNLTL